MKENKIVKLSEREHILKRPSMYIGSIKNEESEEYIFEDGKITLKKLSKTPGFFFGDQLTEVRTGKSLNTTLTHTDENCKDPEVECTVKQIAI